MSRTTLIIGPPGTGKTHHLLERVAEALTAGVPPERIGFFTFTRAAAQEAIARATKQFGLAASRFPHFRTLHSAAYHLVGIRSHEVMRPANYKKLGEQLGLEFSSTPIEDHSRPQDVGRLGDQLLALYSLARARGINAKTQWERGSYYEFPVKTAVEFEAELNRYKRYHGLLDFHDFLVRCDQALDLDLFILDEAQDLTPAEWDLARRLAIKVPRVLVAGDDDQAIYAWSGADVERLINLQGDTTVLPVSHRLPRHIFDLANSISSRIHHRLPKEWRPREGAEGEVSRLPSGGADGVDLREGEWLLLARHRGQLRDLERLVRQQGRTYICAERDVTRSELLRSVLNYEALRAGRKIYGAQVKLLARYILGFEPKVVDEQRLYSYEDLPWPWADRRDWMTALNALDGEAVSYLRSLRRHGESLTDPPKIRITTIHGAKGLEADNVLLLTWANLRTRKAAQLTPDDELRVWYVGVSRARQRLIASGPDYFL